MVRSLACFMLIAVAMLTGGCTKPFVVTTPLSTALTAPTTIRVADIEDELPVDMEAAKKPKTDDIDKFRTYIGEALAKKDVGEIVPGDEAEALYEVQGTFLEYKRGSGAARFFIGFGAGNAHATIGLRLIDTQTGDTVFAGNFTSVVTSWAESGDQIFQRIADDFADEIAKQLKNLPVAETS
jgi:PBP1b-binding outer membrane lipoprotein LpoB